MGNSVETRYVRLAAIVIGVAFASAFVAQVACAQVLQPVNDIAEYVRGFLTGRLATSLAVIAVAVVGYLFWAGQIASQAALAVVAGIAIVFGAGQIVAILEAVAR